MSLATLNNSDAIGDAVGDAVGDAIGDAVGDAVGDREIAPLGFRISVPLHFFLLHKQAQLSL